MGNTVNLKTHNADLADDFVFVKPDRTTDVKSAAHNPYYDTTIQSYSKATEDKHILATGTETAQVTEKKAQREIWNFFSWVSKIFSPTDTAVVSTAGTSTTGIENTNVRPTSARPQLPPPVVKAELDKVLKQMKELNSSVEKSNENDDTKTEHRYKAQFTALIVLALRKQTEIREKGIIIAKDTILDQQEDLEAIRKVNQKNLEELRSSQEWTKYLEWATKGLNLTTMAATGGILLFGAATIATGGSLGLLTVVTTAGLASARAVTALLKQKNESSLNKVRSNSLENNARREAVQFDQKITLQEFKDAFKQITANVQSEKQIANAQYETSSSIFEKR